MDSLEATPSLSGTAAKANPHRGLLASTWAQFAAVVLLAILPYLQTVRFGFVYDDDAQVLRNPLLLSWRSLGTIFTKHSWSFLYPQASVGYYRPVFLVWLSLNRHLFGWHAGAWHLASLALHGLVAGLCFLLIRRHGFQARIAFLSALFFALHPTHVESVAWISGATDPLAAAALLSSLLVWWRSRDTRSGWSLIGSLLLYFAALLSKETALMFPAIVLIYSLVYPRRNEKNEGMTSSRATIARRACYETAPFVIATAIYLLLRQMVLGQSAAMVSLAGVRTALATAPVLLAFYVGHLVWPVHLSLFYNIFPTEAIFWRWWLLCALLVAAAVLLIWLALRWREPAVCALAWILFPLLPVLWVAHFGRGDLAHDRYLYLPGIGAALLCAAFFRAITKESRLRMRAATTAVAAGLALLAVVTAVEARPWADDLSLYQHACSESPHHPIACNNLAVALNGKGDFVQAREVLRQLLDHAERPAKVTTNFAIASYRLGDYTAAEDALRRAIRFDPSYAEAYLYLGLTCLRTNRPQEAESLLRRALALDPSGEGYHLALGTVLMDENRYRDACEEFRAELLLQPGLPAASTLLRGCEQRLAPAN